MGPGMNNLRENPTEQEPIISFEKIHLIRLQHRAGSRVRGKVDRPHRPESLPGRHPLISSSGTAFGFQPPSIGELNQSPVSLCDSSPFPNTSRTFTPSSFSNFAG